MPDPSHPSRSEPRPEYPVPPENYLYSDRTPPLALAKPLIRRTWFILLMLVVLSLGMSLFLRWMR